MSGCYVADDADIIGDVSLDANVNIWYHTTIRADDAKITIGKGSNIQDNCVLHVDEGFPLSIGEYVTVGHGVILHGCSIGNNTVVGMGAILLNACKIGKNCIIGAGTLVTQNTVIEDGSVVIGNPGKVKRQIRNEEIAHNRENAEEYIKHAEKYLKIYHQKQQ